MSSGRTRLAKRLAWLVFAPLAAVLFLRAFVADVYYVDSRSMAPTLQGGPTAGDYVLVQFGAPPELERFDLVVLQRPAESEPLVKRVVALGGETLQVASGDLLIDGRMLAPEAPRPPWVLLFDSRLESVESYFSVARYASRWRRNDHELVLEGDRGVVAAEWIPRALDEHYDAKGERVNGKRHAQDLALELELRLEGSWRELRLRLTEEGDRFDLVLEPAGLMRAAARFERRAAPRMAVELLAQIELDFDAAALHHLVFSNVDNRLEFALDGQLSALVHDYSENTPMWGLGEGFAHQLPRAAFGGEGLALAVRRVRLWRDVFWVEHGRFGVDQPLVLAPDELFVMGDNSGESRDSREWGPARRNWIVGRPRAVVWPPSRWRWLSATSPRR